MAKGANITLVRGRNYSVIHPTDRRKGSYTFERGKPRFIDDEEVIKVCEDLFEVIIDSDDEEVEKPIFLVERGNIKNAEEERTTRRRLPAGQPRSTRRAVRKV